MYRAAAGRTGKKRVGNGIWKVCSSMEGHGKKDRRGEKQERT
jgi:hypothetical protein